MSRSAFLFFKTLGLLFAILIGIVTAVLGWYDAADWINIVFYSTATAALILWGWHHFSIRWIHNDLKQDIFSHVSKKEKIETEEITHEESDEENYIRHCEYAAIVFQLHELLKAQLKHTGMDGAYRNIEITLAGTLAALEMTGVKLDVE